MTTGVGRALAWIETNLWAILCAVVTAGSGILIGMTTANHRLDTVEKELVKLETKVDLNARRLTGRSEFMVCASRQIDRLNDRLDITPPCELEVPE